jgi:branched-chain amino acid transport system permease protein
VVETIIQGLLLGGLYGLFALGQALIFGVMRLTNTAHGDFIIMGGFIAFGLTLLGASPWFALGITIPVTWLVGYVTQRYMLNQTLNKDPLPSLVVTFGLSIVIQNLLLEINSADPRSISTSGFNTMSLALGDNLAIGALPLTIFIIALLATIALQWFFNNTQAGRSFRAVSDDREIAELMGLKAGRVYAQATALAFGLIGLAGALQAMRTTIAPTDGPMLLLFAFEAVIIGGMGSFWGTLTGALLLGLTQQIVFRIDPGWGIWGGHVMFLLVLMLRPEGLFPKTRG